MGGNTLSKLLVLALLAVASSAQTPLADTIPIKNIPAAVNANITAAFTAIALKTSIANNLSDLQSGHQIVGF
jgi:hypothetical protein